VQIKLTCSSEGIDYPCQTSKTIKNKKSENPMKISIDRNEGNVCIAVNVVMSRSLGAVNKAWGGSK
jgi:hypothetical protein